MNQQEAENLVRLFGMANQMAEHDLNRIEKQFKVDLHRNHVSRVDADQEYYPQIEASIRSEAAEMAPHYEIFYSLEKTIRGLIADTLEAKEGDDWWESGRIKPEKIKADSEDRRQREIDTGATPRSTEAIDFTTFGELGEIIKANWDLFGSLFSSKKAVERVMANLNTLRGPVAHCSPLAEDEVVRLELSVRDWFRLME